MRVGVVGGGGASRIDLTTEASAAVRTADHLLESGDLSPSEASAGGGEGHMGSREWER